MVRGATALIRPPREWRDLLRRRVRAQVGTVEIEQDEVLPGATARTNVRDVLGIAGREPRIALRIALFLAVAVLARAGARRAVRCRRLHHLAAGREQPAGLTGPAAGRYRTCKGDPTDDGRREPASTARWRWRKARETGARGLAERAVG